MVHRLNEVLGVKIPADAIERRPSIPLSTLSDPPALQHFLEVLDAAVRQIRAASTPHQSI
jgi:hypothetical protein